MRKKLMTYLLFFTVLLLSFFLYDYDQRVSRIDEAIEARSTSLVFRSVAGVGTGVGFVWTKSIEIYSKIFEGSDESNEEPDEVPEEDEPITNEVEEGSDNFPVSSPLEANERSDDQ